LRTDKPTKGVFHPSSVLATAEDTASWVCYHSIVETSRTFLSVLTPIASEWLREDSEAFAEVVARRKADRLEPVVIDSVRPSVMSKLAGRGYEQGMKTLATKIDAEEVHADNQTNRIVAWCKCEIAAAVRQKLEAILAQGMQ